MIPKIPAKHFQAAIDAQGACNLGALVHSFSRIMADIQKAGRNKGTDWINQHPISRMFAEQISFLANKPYQEAYNECEENSPC